MKATDSARDNARAQLRALCPVGATVYTILRHTSRSGMRRHISVKVLTNNPLWPLQDITALVGLACGLRTTKEGPVALVVNGCGMDMGYHVVDSLGWALWNNAEGVEPGRAGYTLKHEWL